LSNVVPVIEIGCTIQDLSMAGLQPAFEKEPLADLGRAPQAGFFQAFGLMIKVHG